MTDATFLTAAEIRDLILSRRASAVEVARDTLRRLAQTDKAIGAFVTVDEEATMQSAEMAQRRVDAGDAPPLLGVPYAVKDMTDTAGIRTTYGSRLYENHVPAEDAAVVRRLKQAGGVFIGKTNTPEFGNRATTAFGLFPPTHNPWDVSKTAGGSSGGSAAAVAAGIVPIAEGTDGGGSIRIPSSCCGVVGIKPSRGRVSSAPINNPRGGLVTNGPIARTVGDAALMLDVMAGYEPGDPYFAPLPLEPFAMAARRDPKPLRIGMLVTSEHRIDPEVIAAVEQAAILLESLGHIVEPADIDLGGLSDMFRVMCHAESAANDISDPSLYSDPFSIVCYEKGRRWSAADYIRAIEQVFGRARVIVSQCSKWDCVITPTITQVPPPLDTFLANLDTVNEDDLGFIPFTYPFNISGQPAMSVPLGWSGAGLPIGIQLVGQPYQEALLIALAGQVERAASWTAKYPPQSVRSDR